MAWMQPLVRRRGCGGRSAVHLFRVALPRSRRVRPAEPRSVALGRACRDPAQIGPTHALNPTAGGGSAPRTPAPRLLCRAWPPCRQGGGGRPGPRLAARAILPALGLACPSVPALCWSPCGCGRAVGRVAPGLGGSSGLVCGVCCGWFLLSRFVPRCRRAAWVSSALGSLVASARRVCPGRWRVSLAAAGVVPLVLWGRGRGRVLVARRRCRVRGGLGRLGRVSAGRAAVRRGRVGRLGSGGPAGAGGRRRSRRPARRRCVGAGRVGGWGFSRRPGGRRGGSRCLIVRCPSPALASLVCRRARAFGRPPERAGRRGLLVLLPASRPRGPSTLAVRVGAGPTALSVPPALPGLSLPVPPRGGRSHSPVSTRSAPAASLRQSRLF